MKPLRASKFNRKRPHKHKLPGGWLRQGLGSLVLSGAQEALAKKHGTPAEFAEACYKAVPYDVSMDEARAAVDRYQKEWDAAYKDRSDGKDLKAHADTCWRCFGKGEHESFTADGYPVNCKVCGGTGKATA